MKPALLWFLLSIAAQDAFATTCARRVPFLETARDADVVLVGRLGEGREVAITEVIRGAALPSSISIGGTPYAAPGTRWLFALHRQRERYVVGQCHEGAIAITGEWAIGVVSESPRRVWGA